MSKDHRFWNTQPVIYNSPGPLEIRNIDDIKQNPYKLPDGFVWDILDWENDITIEEAYILLRDNYVASDDEVFRFDYSRDFLKWALMPPNWKKNWQVGVRNSKSRKLLAMITGTFAHISCSGDVVPMVEINFLCIHKSLRGNRLTPVLIKEITRRANEQNVWQAIYTIGAVVPTPFGTTKYWHRSLNLKKLVEIGFSNINERQTIQRMERLLQLPENVTTFGWRPLQEKDLFQVGFLLRGYLSQFDIHVKFQDFEIGHIFLPRKDVISSYVVEQKDGKISDFASFYHVNCSINNSKYKTLRAVYSFYNVPGSLSLQDLMQNLLIEANIQKYDVFNVLDIMNNRTCMEPLKFKIGDSNLHYYLYNYMATKSESIGVILV